MVKLRKNQGGFASFIIVLTLVLVLSLITVGFAQLIRRQQANTLNKQLSTQAFYAAETAVNDVVKNISTLPTNPSNCSQYFGGSGPLNNILAKDSSNNTTVSYTCVLLDKAPGDLVYSNVRDGNNKSTTFTTSSAVQSIKISWITNDNQKTVAGAPTPGTPYLQYKSNWTHPAVLELGVTPLDGYTLNHDNLVSNTFTTFLYPSGGTPNSVDFVPSASGSVTEGNCSSIDGSCSVSIKNIPAGHTSFLVHFLDLYDSSNVTIKAYSSSDATGTSLKTNGGQIMIDATGKAQDVLRRIQVRVPITPMSLPAYAIEAQNVCKRMQVYPGGASFDTAYSASCQVTP